MPYKCQLRADLHYCIVLYCVGLILVSSMALDWLTSVLYVSDAGLHKIFACSTSTGQCSEIISVHLAFSMDIDAING